MNIEPYSPQWEKDVRAIALAVSSNPDKTPQEQEDQYNTYLAYFLDHEPAHCFVALSDGRPVGYIVGTCEPDKYLSAIPAYVSRLADPAPLRHEIQAVTAMADRCPAHLHINILPAGQGKGTGRALLAAFEASIGHQPVFLGVRKDRPQAIRFYEKNGFCRYKEDEGGYTYVKDGQTE